MTDCVSEKDTPGSFNLSYDDERVPQRELTDFVVSCAEDKISICSLDESRSTNNTVHARGTVVAGGRTLKILSDPLIEWCIEYGQNPKLWVRSAHVWYRLTKPAKEYAKTHEVARRRFELCSRIYILGTNMSPKECTYALFVQFLSAPYLKMKGYSEKEILTEKDFILAQIANLKGTSLGEMTFVKELRAKKPNPPKKPPLGGRKASSSSSLSLAGDNLGEWVPSGNLDVEGNVRLLKRAEKAVNQLYKNKNAWPFREPVNPVAEGCPDYFQRIQRPMDFGTIKKKFEKHSYADALEVAKDVRLVAANCREYNGDDHEFAIWATELEKKFENVMRGGEDMELTAMNKRTSSKKRKASDQLPPSGKGSGKKSAAKAARKNGKTSSADVSPSRVSRDSSSKDEEQPPQNLCARSSSEECKKLQVAGSKYCSDECGLIVAKKRVAELKKAGYCVEEYIKTSLVKALVHSRG